jgi:hypothetical protein
MNRKKTFVLVAILVLALSGNASSATEPAEAPAEAESYQNTVKWATASEVDNFGYDVYRGDSPDGPFERLTEEPVEGAGTSDEVHRYQFVDDTIDPTKTYYYYVESISMAGIRERFTPVGKVKPKIPQKEESKEKEPKEEEEPKDPVVQRRTADFVRLPGVR